jgi:hypothetical protein
MPLRCKVAQVLPLLAIAVECMEKRGLAAPILVGGAAVELYTLGRVTFNVFDFVSPCRHEFFTELKVVGFVSTPLLGWLKRSIYHPKLGVTVQVVSRQLMNGRADIDRIVKINIGRPYSQQPLPLEVVPIEDLMADRISQALRAGPIATITEAHAVALYQRGANFDDEYLDRRIRAETRNRASLKTLVACAGVRHANQTRSLALPLLGPFWR